jgi:hypothetical protein
MGGVSIIILINNKVSFPLCCMMSLLGCMLSQWSICKYFARVGIPPLDETLNAVKESGRAGSIREGRVKVQER